MGLLDSLFGSSPDADTSQEPTLNPRQMQLLNQFLLPMLIGELLGGGGQNIPGLNPLEGGVITGFEDLLGNVQSDTGLQGSAETALTDILTQDPTDINAFFESNVFDPLFELFQEKVLPTVQNQFGGQFFGGERREDEIRATDDLLTNLTRSRESLAFNAREADRNARLSAAGLVPSLTNNLLNVLGGAAGAGAIPRDIAQQQQGAQSDVIDQILAALGIQPFENITTVDPGQTGIIPGAIGGFAQGAGAAAGKSIF